MKWRNESEYSRRSVRAFQFLVGGLLTALVGFPLIARAGEPLQTEEDLRAVERLQKKLADEEKAAAATARQFALPGRCPTDEDLRSAGRTVEAAERDERRLEAVDLLKLSERERTAVLVEMSEKQSVLPRARDRLEALQKRDGKCRLPDDQAWAAARISDCSAPRDTFACDGVQGYLNAFPAGRHLDEARRLLVAASGPLMQLVAEADVQAWASARVSDCAAPEASSACDGVQGYLNAFPAGKHAGDAKQLLEAASGSLLQFADDEKWKQADPVGCKKPTSSTDCNGLENYVFSYPKGKHASEATRVLKGAERKIEALRGAEMRRHEAAEILSELCQNLRQQEEVEQAETLSRRVDAASGTVSLGQRRQMATAKLLLRDQRLKLAKQLQDAGVRFDRNRDCAGTGEDE